MTHIKRREHYQWNMDIVGVPGVEAKAELLAAITTFFQRVGLTSQDVGIRVSSRKVVAALMAVHKVPEEIFAKVCVVVDKLDKLPRESIQTQLEELGLPPAAATNLVDDLTAKNLDDLERVLGPDSEAVRDLRQLFALAEGYGYRDWLVLDPRVVRGLAYYTGIVFEGFDRAGVLRAICGGGRYDRLISTYGGPDLPCVGFGFGDAVIVELLKEKNLLPAVPHKVDDLVFPLGPDMRPAAAGVASRLRAAGRSVDLVLDDKKVKWALKQAERVGAARLLLVGSDEWARGCVQVRDLAARSQTEVPVADLVPQATAN